VAAGRGGGAGREVAKGSGDAGFAAEGLEAREVVDLGAIEGSVTGVTGLGALGGEAAGPAVTGLGMPVGGTTGVVVTGLGMLGGETTGAVVAGLGMLVGGTTGVVAAGLGAVVGEATGAAGAGLGTLAGEATGAVVVGLGAVGAAGDAATAGAAPLIGPCLVAKTPLTSSGTIVRLWSVLLAKPREPIAARISGRGRSSKAVSCVALSANVPGGELRRNIENGIRTAPVRNCSKAMLAGKVNIPPGRDKTSGASVLGNRKSTSFKGNEIWSPLCFAAGPFATTGELGAGADGRTGARTSAAVVTAGGGGADFENSFLKTPNMDRAAGHTASTSDGSSRVNYNAFF
jgi:hypothetical protein